LAPTVGIAATGFCYLGGILQFSIGDISKFFLHHQDQQRVQPKIHGAKIWNSMKKSRSTNFMAADNRSSQIDSTEFIVNISYHQHQLSSTSSRSSNTSPSRIVEFVQIDGSQNNSS
jgi:hypothetical protein